MHRLQWDKMQTKAIKMNETITELLSSNTTGKRIKLKPKPKVVVSSISRSVKSQKWPRRQSKRIVSRKSSLQSSID